MRFVRKIFPCSDHYNFFAADNDPLWNIFLYFNFFGLFEKISVVHNESLFYDNQRLFAFIGETSYNIAIQIENVCAKCEERGIRA